MAHDTVIYNANIHTMDQSRPRAAWLHMRDGLILALGDGAAPDAETSIDAGGRLVLPGFQDAHIHLLNGGVDLLETAQLYECTSLAEIKAVMASHAAGWTGPMVWGAGWQCGFFGDQNLTKAVLDAVVPDRPCLIFDGNFHNACLNSAAIDMAGIDDHTPDPQNGHFVRDASGHATGILHEDAIAWAVKRLPQTSEATLKQGLLAGQAHANRHGITGVLDAQILDYHRQTYADAAAQGVLGLRVAGAMHVSPAETVDSALARLIAWRDACQTQDFHLHSAKFFLDGGFENRTAATIAPYADAKGGNAPLMFTPDQIWDFFTALDAARFQIHVHCIGDAATRAALDGFGVARAANGSWPSLHQIAHCQLVHPDDHSRFRDLGVMANFQPLWACTDPVIPDDTMAMIGPARARWTYALGSIIAAGAPFCISSDWAVTTLNSFEIIGTATTREPPRFRGRASAFFPDEAITVQEAVLGYTTHAAAACWRSGFSGALRPGYSADAIVLDRDIMTCDPYDVATTEVLLTLFKGKPVYRNPGF